MPKVTDKVIVEESPEEPKVVPSRPVRQIVEIVDDSGDSKPVMETVPPVSPQPVVTPTVIAPPQESLVSPFPASPVSPEPEQTPVAPPIVAPVIVAPPSVIEPPMTSVETPSKPTPMAAEKTKEVVGELFQSSSSGVMPEISMHAESHSRPILVWVFVVIGICAAIGGTALFLSKRSSSDNTAVSFRATPTPNTETVQPTTAPTPEAAMKKEDFKIKVLNGGGTPGAAGKMKKALEAKGYTVSGTGNTEEYSYEETEILVKKGKEALLESLKTDLASDYTIGTAEASLAESETEDAHVIVGKK